ncbi:phage tail protein [Escherichia coli]
MSAKFYTLLTDIGAAKLASAAALGVPLKITQMAVGDGGGVLPTPSAQQTALVAEKRRASLNMLYIDPQNSSQIIAEQVIPETEGGWWIREVGLFDETGALIAVGNCPESYKPQLAEGSGRTQTVRMVLITSSTDNITLKIDPAVVLATRKYVDDKVLELKVYVDDLMSKHLAAADPHTQYAPKESPTLTGMPKVPTAPAGTNTTQIASTAFVQAVVTALNNALALKAPLASPALTGAPTAPTAAQTVNNTQVATTAFVKSAIAALVASSPAALDTLNELAEALGNDPNFATTMTNALAGKQPLDTTLTSLSGKSISELLQYLGLQTIRPDPRSTKIYSPDLKKFLMVSDTIWGMWNGESNTPVALTIEQGGTGKTTVDGVKAAFGIDKLQPKGEYADKSAETPQIFSDAIKAKYGLEIKDANEIGSVSLYAANNEASIHGWSGQKITIPDKAGTMALAGESVTALRLSSPREVTVTSSDAWVNFTTSEMVVGLYITPTPGNGPWVLNKVRVATLQANINGAWVNVTQ